MTLKFKISTRKFIPPTTKLHVGLSIFSPHVKTAGSRKFFR